ncbi:gliding motility-associated C-terminal domain-containing protein [Fluviicola sp.]|jgi:gliding motility-associated-like protein|uniref:T9SS type B sorting domain-containing protein n=1 Tax=Fluviicola sp. TaxID=1917219 RepID=UPI00281BEE91|nr:gliding motility-associated C-terminal domain-containing protein [Fluviicola sp.]MDR0802181.1 gliding motility-associated C-terminal domain-containing protein [Fluviicola sp.]
MKEVLHTTLQKVSAQLAQLSGSMLFLLLSVIAQNQSFSQMKPKENRLNGFQTREVKNLEAWKKFNSPEFYSHPEFGKLPDNAPCENCVEVLEKRKVDERYFINVSDNQEFYTQKALGDLHQWVNGQWISIEHELHPVSGMRYESGYLLDQAAIDFAAKRTELKTANGTFQFNNWKLVVVRNGEESEALAANWSDYTVGPDGALVRNIFPGINAEMIVLRGAIKTSFIIKSNEFGVFDNLLFREELEGLNALHAEFTNGTYTQGIGNLKLLSGSTELALMDEGKLYAKNSPKDLARSAAYKIHANKIDLVVDYSWINQNIDLYQLVVDPLVTGTGTLAQASITGSRYNATCTFATSCDYNLVVPCPANATFTDATFSFTYTANGILCWLQDGAMRIGTGSCISPSATGYYWFCNGIGGGNCSATNQSVFSDLSSCMPAPGCVAQNVTFTLKFYRSCYGATGCSNACIGAGSPWVMNVTGRTLEYTNQTTPVTLSGTTVCQGGTLTASTSAAYGVPGYTYNWSFNPTGTPSVGTGTSTGISFPTSGTVTLYSIVTDACGNQVTSSRTITVTPGTPPTITAGGPTTFCAGNSVVLTSSSATGNTWSTGATTQSITVSASGSYMVTTSGSGCSATSAATVVTVNPIPATPAITASGPTTFCSGGSITLTSSSATGNIWSTGETTQSITVTTSGTYSVTVSSNGCTSSAVSTTVTVSPVPAVPTITAGGPTTFCSGNNVVLTSSSAAGNTWSTGAATQSITVTASGSYTVTVTNGSGCSATSAATTVTVNPVPAVPTITAGGPTTFCSGNNVVLTSSSATGNTWSTGATTQSITVTASGSYTVMVTNGSGCSATSATTTVTVNPVPAVPTITASDSTTFCSGNNVVLTSSSAAGNTWSTGVTAQSITVTTSGTYTVTVTNGSGCSATSAVTTVTVNPVPAVPTITAGGPTTFCSGNNVVLTSSSATGNTWSTGATTQSITATTSGTYTVTVSNGFCSVVSVGTTITVNPLPIVAASSNGPLCVGDELDLAATGAGGGTFSWTGPNGFSSALQNPIVAAVTAVDFGTYTVTLTVNSCSSSAITTVTLNPGNSTAINSVGAFCENGAAVLLTPVTPGGSWSGTGIVNAATGLFDPGVAGTGSHVITYDIPGSCAGPSTITIVVNAAPVVGFSADKLSGCPPLNVVFTNSTPLTVNAVWNFGNGQSSTSVGTGTTSFLSQGCYNISLSVTDNNGCTGTMTKPNLVCVNPEATAAFTPSPYEATVTSPEIQFINHSANASSYIWLFGDGGTSAAFSPVHAYGPVTGDYLVKLVATNAFGCLDTASVIVRILDELIYYVPNCFTPNGDEHNNTFQPVFTSGFDIYSFTMNIFDRWGELIWESHDPQAAWDGTYNGTIVPEGAYTWTVTFRDSNNDKKYTAKGHLTVMR